VRSGVSELFGATHFRQSNTSGRQLITSPQVLLWVCGNSACHSSLRDILRRRRNDPYCAHVFIACDRISSDQRRRRAPAQWPAPTSVRHTVCIRHFPHQVLIWCSDLARSSLSTEPECLRGFEIDDQFILGLGPRHRRLQRDSRSAKRGCGSSCTAAILNPLMSTLGQKQTSDDCRLLMSAIHPKADIAEYDWGCPLCARNGHSHLR
jgi:hypothetical protein